MVKEINVNALDFAALKFLRNVPFLTVEVLRSVSLFETVEKAKYLILKQRLL